MWEGKGGHKVLGLMYAGIFCAWDPARSLPGTYWSQVSVDHKGVQTSMAPATPAHPMHSLIELRGPVQRLADIGWQVPGVLRGIPGQLLALGVVHVANVVEGSCLPNLWAAARYEGMFYSPPENSPRGTFPGVVQSPGLLGP